MSIYPYKTGSNSAKLLATALGVKRIKLQNSSFKGNENKKVINWGSSTMSEETIKCEVLNSPDAVKTASNKLTFFQTVDGKCSIPEYTDTEEVAREWYDNGELVVARSILSGHSGKGIFLLKEEGGDGAYPWNDITTGEIPLFVKYIPKRNEYRVHVVMGEVIDVRRKARRKDFNDDQINWKIRNHENGFVFAKDGFEPEEEVLQEAVKAVLAAGLDFGAVDVIYNNFRKKAYVLEINTAPGLEGSTVDNYAEAFQKFYEDENEYVSWQKRKNIYLGKSEQSSFGPVGLNITHDLMILSDEIHHDLETPPAPPVDWLAGQ